MLERVSQEQVCIIDEFTYFALNNVVIVTTGFHVEGFPNTLPTDLSSDNDENILVNEQESSRENNDVLAQNSSEIICNENENNGKDYSATLTKLFTECREITEK